MATTINADDGVSSGSAGLKESADSSGVLALQTNGTTAVSISTGQVVTLTNALPVASGGTGATTNAGTAFALKGANSDITSLSGLTTALSVGQGGTGLTTATGVLVGSGSSVSAVAAGTNGNVLTSNGTTWVSQAAASGGTAPVYTVVTTPGTWTKPATVKAIQVTVVGGGGNGGSATTNNSSQSAYGGAGGGAGGAAIRLYPAPSLPGPQPYTVGTAGGTSSFGVAPITVISATGGSAGGNVGNSTPTSSVSAANGGAGGVGSNGNANINGGGGGGGAGNTLSPHGYGISGVGGSSILGGGGVGYAGTINGVVSQTGANGGAYGAGAAGGFRSGTGPNNNPGVSPGGTGATGVVIIEEFY